MDPLQFYEIVERDLDLQNPMAEGTLDALAAAAGVGEGSRVLDVGSGKGALLRRWSRLHAIDGTGLELNPAFVRDARERAVRDGGIGRVHFVEGPARAFAAERGAYDVAACLGAPFAIGDFGEAVAWLRAAVRSGGAIVIGDRYLAEPLGATRGEVDDEVAALPDLAGVHDRLASHGLTVTAVFGSSTADWDRYLSAWWTAAADWAEANPDHPDRAELLAEVAADRERYLRIERRHVGWAAWVARR
jgi:SAM-dependent methyltransferase